MPPKLYISHFCLKHCMFTNNLMQHHWQYCKLFQHFFQQKCGKFFKMSTHAFSFLNKKHDNFQLRLNTTSMLRTDRSY